MKLIPEYIPLLERKGHGFQVSLQIDTHMEITELPLDHPVLSGYNSIRASKQDHLTPIHYLLLFVAAYEQIK